MDVLLDAVRVNPVLLDEVKVTVTPAGVTGVMITTGVLA
jgi:hypothetical protein